MQIVKMNHHSRQQLSMASPTPHPTHLVADGPQEVEAVYVVQPQVRRQPRYHLHGVLHPGGVHPDARAAEVLLALEHPLVGRLRFGRRRRVEVERVRPPAGATAAGRLRLVEPQVVRQLRAAHVVLRVLQEAAHRLVQRRHGLALQHPSPFPSPGRPVFFTLLLLN